MIVLGIESSCDETAAAVVEDGKIVLSNAVASQVDIHKEFGGVVPEVAARSHIEVINHIIQKAFDDSGCNWTDIDAIAVSQGPGLSGSLLIGTLAARTLAITKDKPLYGLHHVEGHMYANFLIEPQPKFPILALLVSGLHSQLVLFRDHFDYTLLGQTLDDAAGEAFDKVARLIGLPYPGGPSIGKLAPEGDDKAIDLPIARLENPYDFSFSGLKTATLRAAQKAIGKDYRFPSFEIAQHLTTKQQADFAASFQRTAVKTLVDATKHAFEEYSPASVVIAGGVAANQLLRTELANAIPIDINYAPISLCTDNAAMMAALGYYKAQRAKPDSPYDLVVKPSWSM